MTSFKMHFFKQLWDPAYEGAQKSHKKTNKNEECAPKKIPKPKRKIQKLDGFQVHHVTRFSGRDPIVQGITHDRPFEHWLF